MSLVLDLAVLAAVLGAGGYLAAAVDAHFAATVAGRPAAGAWSAPARCTARWILQRTIATEKPDEVTRRLAPVLYLACAAAGLSVVPLADGAAPVDVEAGIVLWGAIEALTIIAVFLHGWSPNSQLPLIGAYRYVAIGLSAMLVSMFVLIGTALPAESLNVADIVAAQRGVWNAVRQPLGLPLFLLLGLMLSLRGPMDYADSAALSGGTSAESSGREHLAWQTARYAMLVSFAAMASAAFLGGSAGPWLPGPLWLLLKTAALTTIVVALGHALGRPPPSRMMTLIWIVLLPLAFVDLAIAGLEALR